MKNKKRAKKKKKSSLHVHCVVCFFLRLAGGGKEGVL
jgi:hypothetical protein